jgi:O-antigen ligase
METNLEKTGPGSAKAVDSLRDTRHRVTWIEVGLIVLLIMAGVGLAFIAIHWSFKLALLVILVIVGSLIVIKRPEIGLNLIILAIPLEDFNKIGDLGSISLIKLLTLGVLGAYLIHHFVINQEEKFINPTQNVNIIALLLAVLVSYFAALDPNTAISHILKFVRMAAFYFLVINIVRSKAILQRVVWTMIITGIFSAGYGVYEYYFTPEALMDMRISGTHDDPMSFSYSLVVLLPLIWCLIARKRRLVLRVLLIAVGFLFSYAIVLSGTRSGILAAIGVLAWIALRQRRTIILNTLVIFVIAAFSLFFMPEQVKNRLGLTAITDKAALSSSERRITYYTFGLDLFMHNPILGTGLGGFTQAYSHSEYQYLRTGDDVDRIAHNMYLEIGTGAGLVGLIPFFLILLTPLIGLQSTIHKLRSGSLPELAKMIQISLTAFIFIGFFSSSQYDKPLWLIIGLATAIIEIAKTENQTALLAMAE